MGSFLKTSCIYVAMPAIMINLSVTTESDIFTTSSSMHLGSSCSLRHFPSHDFDHMIYIYI